MHTIATNFVDLSARLKAQLEKARPGDTLHVNRAAEGMQPLIAGTLAPLCTSQNPVDLLVITRDADRMADYASAIAFASPQTQVIQLAPWDCLPFDSASPSTDVQSQRMRALWDIGKPRKEPNKPRVLIASATAALQRLIPRKRLRARCRLLRQGQTQPMSDLVSFLEKAGFRREKVAQAPGTCAVRGGLIDIRPFASERGWRLDFFGDQIDAIRIFDAQSQLTIAERRSARILPVCEVWLDEETVNRFRQAYVGAFGSTGKDDPLYQAIKDHRTYPGMEHWMASFVPRLENVLTITGDCPVIFDQQAFERIAQDAERIRGFHQERQDALAEDLRARNRELRLYRPPPLDDLYLPIEEARALLASRRQILFDRVRSASTRAAQGDDPEQKDHDDAAFDLQSRSASRFYEERASSDTIIAAFVKALSTRLARGESVLIATRNRLRQERFSEILAHADLPPVQAIASMSDLQSEPAKGIRDTPLAVTELSLRQGFVWGKLNVISEDDLFGPQPLTTRNKSRARRFADKIVTLEGLKIGDHVVHLDHGIARFEGVETITVGEITQDYLRLLYRDNDFVLLPADTIELLSRYGSSAAEVQLDKLGAAGWQARKARVKGRIQDIAKSLVDVAAQRALASGPMIKPQHDLYAQFVARFPFSETEDQRKALLDVFSDLADAQPMDRLICGDVGFGKTEVAMRAAFVTIFKGFQVAFIAPTTLLANQHSKTLAERFAGFPAEIVSLSRLSSTAQRREALARLADGSADLVVGTHALLAKKVRFKRLGLLVVDEEQRFGVTHKERMKAMRTDVNILTLSATPIPRTLQLAMTGLRDLSIIATPPVERLAVDTFVIPFDRLTIREAIMREFYRDGQTFFVCPRIKDQPKMEDFLKRLTPQLRIGTVNGRMDGTDLEATIQAFNDGRLDLLIATNIIELGLDIANANTMIVYRADTFGLSQLYQLRGRVGRGHRRAFAYLVRSHSHEEVNARLEVMQSLNYLGAGFEVAGRDLDMRGAGNLLGAEQSGHIREVGFELYQLMLDEAVATLKTRGETTTKRSPQNDPSAEHRALDPDEASWTPIVKLDLSIGVPLDYVGDGDLRIQIFQEIGALNAPEAIEAYAHTLRDRFGPLPESVKNLLMNAQIKHLCRRANIARLDYTPAGYAITFRASPFDTEERFARLLSETPERFRFTADQRLLYRPGDGDGKNQARSRQASALAIASRIASCRARP